MRPWTVSQIRSQPPPVVVETSTHDLQIVQYIIMRQTLLRFWDVTLSSPFVWNRRDRPPLIMFTICVFTRTTPMAVCRCNKIDVQCVSWLAADSCDVFNPGSTALCNCHQSLALTSIKPSSSSGGQIGRHTQRRTNPDNKLHVNRTERTNGHCLTLSQVSQPSGPKLSYANFALLAYTTVIHKRQEQHRIARLKIVGGKPILEGANIQ